jgi:hypothetical protein
MAAERKLERVACSLFYAIIVDRMIRFRNQSLSKTETATDSKCNLQLFYVYTHGIQMKLEEKNY